MNSRHRNVIESLGRPIDVPTVHTYFGVEASRVLWLIHDYEARTLKSANTIDPKAPHMSRFEHYQRAMDAALEGRAA